MEALRERLGQVGMIRFLGHYENGAGDYAPERREWVENTWLAEIRESLGVRRSE